MCPSARVAGGLYSRIALKEVAQLSLLICSSGRTRKIAHVISVPLVN
jgi:hypothetical protein